MPEKKPGLRYITTATANEEVKENREAFLYTKKGKTSHAPVQMRMTMKPKMMMMIKRVVYF